MRILLLLLVLTLQGCAVVDLVQMCSDTPQVCKSSINTETVTVNGKIYVIERVKP